MDESALTTDLAGSMSRHMPSILRWSGALARQLRRHNIAVSGKHSGSANTDALTLADLGVQELIVGALRDLDVRFRSCRIEAEETTGDLERFARDGELTIGIDPIDGTRQYRDRTGDGYSVMLHLRNRDTVLYSLVFVPESGTNGTWVEVRDGHVYCGADDPGRSAFDVLRSLSPVNPLMLPDSKKIYLIGFQEHDPDRARDVTHAGLEGDTFDTIGGCVYELEARGRVGGSLIHSPNVYDFPVSLHVLRALGGEAVWVHNRQPVNFRETWLDERANMIRLPGIVACCKNQKSLDTLCELARDWNPNRYANA
jgi:3'(2'), 5'-bisphosphate nucleotidase